MVECRRIRQQKIQTLSITKFIVFFLLHHRPNSSSMINIKLPAFFFTSLRWNKIQWILTNDDKFIVPSRVGTIVEILKLTMLCENTVHTKTHKTNITASFNYLKSFHRIEVGWILRPPKKKNYGVEILSPRTKKKL